MNLTSVARAKAYLGITSAGSDAVIARLVSSASDLAIRWCGRPFQRTTYTDARLDGSGSARQRLPDWPIVSLSALLFNQTAVPASADGIAYGYQFDDRFIYLFGAIFPIGFRNIGVSYVAGYTGSESGFIPDAPGPYTITPASLGYASADRGVTFVATGVALALVGGVPNSGQYAFAAGVYTFAAADKNLQVTMSYDYVPGAVEQAVIEMVGTSLKQRDNLGIASKSLRDESITYSDKDMSNSVKGLLYPYKKVVPI